MTAWKAADERRFPREDKFKVRLRPQRNSFWPWRGKRSSGGDEAYHDASKEKRSGSDIPVTDPSGITAAGILLRRLQHPRYRSPAKPSKHLLSKRSVQMQSEDLQPALPVDQSETAPKTETPNADPSLARLGDASSREKQEQSDGAALALETESAALSNATGGHSHPPASTDRLTDQAVKAPSLPKDLTLPLVTEDHNQPWVGPFFWVEELLPARPSEGLSEGLTERLPEGQTKEVTDGPPERVLERLAMGLAEGPSGRLPESVAERVLEDELKSKETDASEKHQENTTLPASAVKTDSTHSSPVTTKNPLADFFGQTVSWRSCVDSHQETEGLGPSDRSDQHHQRVSGPSVQSDQHHQRVFGPSVQPGQHRQRVFGPSVRPDQHTQRVSGSSVYSDKHHQRFFRPGVQPDQSRQRFFRPGVQPDQNYQHFLGPSVQPDLHHQRVFWPSVQPDQHHELIFEASVQPDQHHKLISEASVQPDQHHKFISEASVQPDQYHKLIFEASVQPDQHLLRPSVQPGQHHQHVFGSSVGLNPTLSESHRVKTTSSHGRVTHKEPKLRNNSPQIETYRLPVPDSDRPVHRGRLSFLLVRTPTALRPPSVFQLLTSTALGSEESSQLGVALSSKVQGSQAGNVRQVAGAKVMASQAEVEDDTPFGKRVTNYHVYTALSAQDGITLSVNGRGDVKLKVAKETSNRNDDDDGNNDDESSNAADNDDTEDDLNSDEDDGSQRKQTINADKALRTVTTLGRSDIGLKSDPDCEHEGPSSAVTDSSPRMSSSGDLQSGWTAGRWTKQRGSNHRPAESFLGSPLSRTRDKTDRSSLRSAQSTMDQDTEGVTDTLENPEGSSVSEVLVAGEGVNDGDKHRNDSSASQPAEDAHVTPRRAKRSLLSLNTARKCPHERAGGCENEKQRDNTGQRARELSQELAGAYPPEQAREDEEAHTGGWPHRVPGRQQHEHAGRPPGVRVDNKPNQRRSRAPQWPREQTAAVNEGHSQPYGVHSGGRKRFSPWSFFHWPIRRNVMSASNASLHSDKHSQDSHKSSDFYKYSQDFTNSPDLNKHSQDFTNSPDLDKHSQDSHNSSDIDDSDAKADDAKEENSVQEIFYSLSSEDKKTSGAQHDKVIDRLFHLLDVYFNMLIPPFHAVPSRAGDHNNSVVLSSRQQRNKGQQVKSGKSYRSYFQFPLGNNGWASLLNSRYPGLYKPRYVWAKI